VPENAILFPEVLHARAWRAASLIEPRLPLSTALPLNTMQVRLTKTPCPEPVSVPDPMNLPRPAIVALPEALVPLTCPEP
jgi:hypothetical protein